MEAVENRAEKLYYALNGLILRRIFAKSSQYLFTINMF